MLLNRIFPFVFTGLFGLQAPATTGVFCINGSPDNLALHNQILKTQERTRLFHGPPAPNAQFADYFFMEKNLPRVTSPSNGAGNPCGIRSEADPAKQLQSAARDLDRSVPFPRIKRECVAAGLRRESNTSGYLCSSSNAAVKNIGSPGSKGPCVSDLLTDYITWAVNQAIQCLSTRERPIDPLYVLMKFNNETGFSFFQASKGGVGIGQLTSPAIQEINRTAEAHLEKVKSSENPACQAFKNILNQPQPDDATRWCSLVHYSEGLGRSLLYSLSYFVHTRDNLMGPFEQALDKCGLERADLRNMGALAAYGPEGLGVRTKLARTLRESRCSPERFMTRARQAVPYLAATRSKLEEALQLAGSTIRKAEDCIE